MLFALTPPMHSHALPPCTHSHVLLRLLRVVFLFSVFSVSVPQLPMLAPCDVGAAHANRVGAAQSPRAGAAHAPHHLTPPGRQTPSFLSLSIASSLVDSASQL